MIWAQSEPTQLNVGAWGGLYGEMIHGYVGDMFEQETGVKINYCTRGRLGEAHPDAYREG